MSYEKDAVLPWLLCPLCSLIFFSEGDPAIYLVETPHFGFHKPTFSCFSSRLSVNPLNLPTSET